MKTSVSIFIPVFNEEKNIHSLLKQILSQKQDNFFIDKILVVSDGSTDNTISETKKIASLEIELIENKERKGKWFCFTVAQKKLEGSIIISLDGDISIEDPALFSQVVRQMKTNDLVSVRQTPKQGKKNIQSILISGMNFAQKVFESNRPLFDANLCNGRCLAMNRERFRDIIWQDTFGTDVYMYLYNIKLKGTFDYIKNTQIFYTVPSDLEGYLLQSIRASRIKQKMVLFFGDLAKTHLKPFPFTIKEGVLFLKKDKFKFISYLFLKCISMIYTHFPKKVTSTWQTISSTK